MLLLVCGAGTVDAIEYEVEKGSPYQMGFQISTTRSGSTGVQWEPGSRNANISLDFRVAHGTVTVRIMNSDGSLVAAYNHSASYKGWEHVSTAEPTWLVLMNVTAFQGDAMLMLTALPDSVPAPESATSTNRSTKDSPPLGAIWLIVALSTASMIRTRRQ